MVAEVCLVLRATHAIDLQVLQYGVADALGWPRILAYAPRVAASCGFACAPRGNGRTAFKLTLAGGLDKNLADLKRLCPSLACDVCSKGGDFAVPVLQNTSDRIGAKAEFISLNGRRDINYAWGTYQPSEILPMLIWNLPMLLTIAAVLLPWWLPRVYRAVWPSGDRRLGASILRTLKRLDAEELQKSIEPGSALQSVRRLRLWSSLLCFLALLSLPWPPAVLALVSAAPLCVAHAKPLPNPKLPSVSLLKASLTRKRNQIRWLCVASMSWAAWSGLSSANLFDTRQRYFQNIYGREEYFTPGFNVALAWPFIFLFMINSPVSWCIAVRWGHGVNMQNILQTQTEYYVLLQRCSMIAFAQCCTLSLMAAVSTRVLVLLEQRAERAHPEDRTATVRALFSAQQWTCLLLLVTVFPIAYLVIAPPSELVYVFIVPPLMTLGPFLLALASLMTPRLSNVPVDSAFDELHSGQKHSSDVELTTMSQEQTAVRAGAAGKFVATIRGLITGSPSSAAGGVGLFIGADLSKVYQGMELGIPAIIQEWKDAEAPPEIMENIDYVLNQPAGSSELAFQHEWLRDRSVTGEKLPARTKDGTKDGPGLLLEDFAAHETAKQAQLTIAHIFVLRLYTTSAYYFINDPLRRVARDADGVIIQPPTLSRPHPLPITLMLIEEALKRLRATSENTSSCPQSPPRKSSVWSSLSSRRSRSSEATEDLVNGSVRVERDDNDAQLEKPCCQRAFEKFILRLKIKEPPFATLYRGLHDTQEAATFVIYGGTELSVMSSSERLSIAVRYARANSCGLIFRLLVPSFMQMGGDLTFLSAFPHEREILYPPLTYLRPRRIACEMKTDMGVRYRVIDVEPVFPG